MDSLKAKKLEQVLKSRTVGGCRVIKLVNHGKSAAVFSAENTEKEKVALKVFDNDIVEAFGHDLQIHRIEKEIGLQGHNILNLVKILDGGTDMIDNESYYYIVMEFVEGMNLKEYISIKEYGHEIIVKIVEVLFKATNELIDAGIVHRDIKPENIMMSNSGKVILMDLGVLKLIGAKSETDYDEKQFLGTLRYAPPEFLTRTEDDTVEGWRAVNYYQIGAVMHDLISKKELFADRSPYSNLVLAIKEDAPVITNKNIPFEVVQLARDLLIKDWRIRLKVCTITRFDQLFSMESRQVTTIDTALNDLLENNVSRKNEFQRIEEIQRSSAEKREIRKKLADRLDAEIAKSLIQIGRKSVFQTITPSPYFHFQREKHLKNSDIEIRNRLIKLKGSLEQGFSRDLIFFYCFQIDENSLAEISICGVAPGDSIQGDVSEPLKILGQLTYANNPARLDALSDLSKIEKPVVKTIFHGVVGFDEQFYELITLSFIQLLRAGLAGIETEVINEIAKKAHSAKTGAMSLRMHQKKTFYFSY